MKRGWFRVEHDDRAGVICKGDWGADLGEWSEVRRACAKVRREKGGQRDRRTDF